ncbi:unnamed protein product [Didymodactylos carnosus]|uniref:Small ribosomal subunit protein mS33 n=1 Tax=Didymodactylos carnosus TaxID=1234261 RepID=A0A813ZDU3_9BILA|nr:unnamed protein product [Didymodactylos carnosus]CAF0898760.1 unnamed protein product [Didymodactylos carnosus]CAF3587932.1 unnamed protein product [Didymodactylos carnosus]CAF3681578.1 unnamed protein product [Didymodactylos carnosus]
MTASTYAQRMLRLSQRIFTEYPKITFSRKDHREQHADFLKLLEERPHTSGILTSMNYYPRHQEIHYLMEALRYHGLYRNEHKDFQEEVKRLRILRGKQRKNIRAMFPPRLPELAPCCKPENKT